MLSEKKTIESLVNMQYLRHYRLFIKETTNITFSPFSLKEFSSYSFKF